MFSLQARLLWLGVIMIGMLLQSCSDGGSSPRDDRNTIGNPSSIINGLTSDSIVALLTYEYSRDYFNGGSFPYLKASAYLSDMSQFVNASSVSVESQSLSNSIGGTGQYLLETPTSVVTGASPSVSWSIAGYLGNTFSHSFSVPGTFNLTNFSVGDDIDQSTGITITYSNSTSSDSIDVVVRYDKNLTKAVIHPDSTSGGGELARVEPNDGSITLSPSDLAGLKSNRIYNLLFIRKVYDTTSYLGHKIGHYSTYTMNYPFKLVD